MSTYNIIVLFRKKHLLTLFAFLAMAAMAAAKPVDSHTAGKVARLFLKNTTGKDYAALHDITPQTPFREFYVFTLDGDKGFILVAGDDCVVPILGFSETSRFVAEAMPAHVMDWMECYEEQIAFYRDRSGEEEYGGSPEVRRQWSGLLDGTPMPPMNETAVGPLVTTTWNQSPYYNDLCPASGSQRTVTGCVATATAQVMKYWNHPATGYGSHSYTDPNYGVQSANFGATTYDWNNMPTALSSTSSSAQVDAVATLMYHVGVAIEMRYGLSSAGGSGAYTGSNSLSDPAANNALMTYFKYKNTLHFEMMEDYSPAEWDSMLRADLDAGRPIIYQGRDASGGHCFVCDGYNTAGQFHINWGWGGYCDAYYFIGQLNPSPGGTGGNTSGTYNIDNGAVLNIEPITDWNPSATTTVTLASSDAAAGSVSGSGTYSFGQTITMRATANTGNRFYGWSDGSKSNPREMPATGGTISLTATLGPLTGDTLGYCFDATTGWSWGTGGTSSHLYWGIKLPAATVAGRDLAAVQAYIATTGSYDVYVYAGTGSSPTTLLSSRSYTANATGWKTIAFSAPVAVDSSQNIWIFLHNIGIAYPASLSSSGGNTDGLLVAVGHTPDQGVSTAGNDYSFMVRGIFLPSEACPPPTAPAASAVTANGATLTWTGTSDSYTLQAGTPVVPPNPVMALSEGFEGGTMPAGWTAMGTYWRVTSGTGIDSYIGTSNSNYTGAAHGSYNAGCFIGSYTGADTLTTPVLDLGSALSATLDFNFWNTSWGGDINTLNVYYRVDYGDWHLLYTHDQATDGWTAVPTITLTGLADNYQIAFECLSNYSYGMAIDDVVVTVTEALQWTTLDADATSPYALGNLAPETTHWVRVIGDCGDEGVSRPSSVLTFTTLPFTLNVEPDRWYAIASPKHDDGLPSESLDHMAGLLPSAGEFAYDLFRYNEASATWENHKAHTTDFTAFGQARGYLYRRDNAGAITFYGTPNSGTVPIDLTATRSDTLKGFNLVGNPYMHSYLLPEDCYSLTPDGSWLAHNGGYTLQVAEAVMVKTDAPRTLTFSETPANKGSHSTPPALSFTVAGDGLEDVVYARLGEGRGLPKLGHLNAAAPVLSIPVDGRRYAIADLGDDCESFDMLFRAPEGTYTLTFNFQLVRQAHHKSTLNYCHLIDRATGKDIDLLAQNTYTFTHLHTNTFTHLPTHTFTHLPTHTFTINLTPNVEETATGHFAYWDGGAWVVEGEGLLEVYDALGRKVFTENLIPGSTRNLNTQLFPSSGLYLLRLGEKCQKIVVR